MRTILLTLLAVVLVGAAGRYWHRDGRSDAAISGRVQTNAAQAEAPAEPAADAGLVAGSSSEGEAPEGRGRVAEEGLAAAASSPDGAQAERAFGKASKAAPSTYYQWVDERGSVHFAASLDEVPASWRARAGQVALDSAVINRTDVPAAKPVRRRPVVETAAVDRAHDVTIYTAPWCGWCRKTIAFLDARRVEYVNKDIDADEEYAEELREKSGGSSIPYVEIDGHPIRGFNPAQMTALLDN
jgi:glutaredoxin